MSQEPKEIILPDDKVLFGKLKHWLSEHFGTRTFRIEGTIVPKTNRWSNSFIDTELFSLDTANTTSMISGISLPRYKIKRPELWCPDLKKEVISYLQSITKSNHNLPESSF